MAHVSSTPPERSGVDRAAGIDQTVLQLVMPLEEAREVLRDIEAVLGPTDGFDSLARLRDALILALRRRAR
jgi:hypothetical protein